MGYVILESDDILRLTAEVYQRMAQGWKPALHIYSVFGGVLRRNSLFCVPQTHPRLPGPE
jgi:hypothetical protein